MDTKFSLTPGEKEEAAIEVEENIKQRRETRKREDEGFDEQYKNYLEAEAEKE